MSVIEEIAAERRRQIEAEGWSAEHDDEHVDGSLAAAAACYASPVYVFAGEEARSLLTDDLPIPAQWPWHQEWWKPTTRRRDLVKAAALIVAEIERLDRAEAARPAA